MSHRSTKHFIWLNDSISLFYPITLEGRRGTTDEFATIPFHLDLLSAWGWSGGAKVLGKLPVPGRPTYLDYSRTRAYCSCSRCGWGLFGHFFSHLSLLFSSPSLWEMARYRLKYCLKGPLSPKTTNLLSAALVELVKSAILFLLSCQPNNIYIKFQVSLKAVQGCAGLGSEERT